MFDFSLMITFAVRCTLLRVSLLIITSNSAVDVFVI